MFSFVTFLISLVLICLLFVYKGLEDFYNKKLFFESIFLKLDSCLFRTGNKIELWWYHLNFKNIKFIFFVIITRTKQLIISIKRRFDHKQSHFFLKKNQNVSQKNKGSVSFFLKDVVDYKKNLREGREE